MGDRQLEILETLEALVDEIGLGTLLDHLAVVCADKADHLAVNWQDMPASKEWEIAMGQLEEARRNVRV